MPSVAFSPLAPRGLGAPILPGRDTRALTYSGQINREGRGLFQGRYKAAEGEEKLIATTLQPSDARRMLPTWSEPAFRARFRNDGGRARLDANLALVATSRAWPSGSRSGRTPPF